MAACAHDIVARMDADDIALPHRFEVQVPIVEGGVDIVGSSLLEFGDRRRRHRRHAGAADRPRRDRRATRASTSRSTTRPSSTAGAAVEAAGGYRHLALMEDYLLFAKMIEQGCSVANVEEPLVLYRVGAGAYARRGGVALLKSEWRLQRRLQRDAGSHRGGSSSAMSWFEAGIGWSRKRIRTAAYRRFIATKGNARRGEREHGRSD